MKNHGELIDLESRSNVIGHVVDYNAQNILIDQFNNTQRRQETLQTDLHHVEESLRDLLRNNTLELNCKKGDTATQMAQYKNAIAQCRNHIQIMEEENQSLKKHISLLQSFPNTGVQEAPKDKPAVTTQQMRLEDVITQCTTLSDRIRKMEDHNTRLVEEAAKQKCEYERCLDKVASQVVQALLTQRRLQSECCLLRSQVRRLAINNQLDDNSSNNGYNGCYNFNPAEVSSLFPQSGTDEISNFLSDLTESLHSAGFSKHALTETLSNCPTLLMRDNKAATQPHMTSQIAGHSLTHQPIVYPELDMGSHRMLPRDHHTPVVNPYMNFNPYHPHSQHFNVPMYQNVEMAKSPPPLHMIPETMEPRLYQNHRMWNSDESNKMEQNKLNQRFNDNENMKKYVSPSEPTYERKPITRSHSFDNYQFVHNQPPRTDDHSRNSVHGNITRPNIDHQEQQTDRRDHVYSNNNITKPINQSYHQPQPARAQCIALSNDVNSNNNNSIPFHQSYPSFERGRSRNTNRNRHMSPPQVRTNKSQRTFSPPTHRRSRSFDVNLQEQHKSSNESLWMQRHHSNEPQCHLSSASTSSLRSPNVQSNRKKMSSKLSNNKDLPPPPPPPPESTDSSLVTKSAPSSPATSPRLPLSVWKSSAIEESRRLSLRKKEEFFSQKSEIEKIEAPKLVPEKLQPKKVLETNIDEIEPVKLPKPQEPPTQDTIQNPTKTKESVPVVLQIQTITDVENSPAIPKAPPRAKKPSAETASQNQPTNDVNVSKDKENKEEAPKILFQGSRLKKSRLAAPAGSKNKLLRERSKSEKIRPHPSKIASKQPVSSDNGKENAPVFSKTPLRRTISGGEKNKQNFYETSLIGSSKDSALTKPKSESLQQSQQLSNKPSANSKPTKGAAPKKKLSQQKSLVGLMKARFGKHSGIQSKKTETKTSSVDKIEISSPIDFRTLSLEPNSHPPVTNSDKKMTKQKLIEEQQGQIGKKLSQPLSHSQYTKPSAIDEETERTVQDFMNRQNSRRGRTGIRYNPKDQFESSVELIPIGNRAKGSGNSLDVMTRNVENARNKNMKRFSYTDKTVSPVTSSENGNLTREVIKQKSASLDKDKVIRRQNDFENVVVNKGAASRNIKMRSSKRRSRHEYENVVIVPTGKPPIPNDNHPKNKLEKLWKSVSTHSLSKESISSHGSRGNVNQTNEDDEKPPSQLAQQTSYEKAIISSIVQAELEDIKSESKKSDNCKSSVNFSTTSSSKSSTSFDSWLSSSEDSTNRSNHNISYDESPKAQIAAQTKVTSKLPSGSRSSLGSFGYGSGTSNSSASSNGSFPEKQSSLSSGNISQSNISKSYLTPPTQTNSDDKPMRKSLSPIRSISQENKLKDSRLTRSGGIPTNRMRMGVRSITSENSNAKIQSGKPLSSKLTGGFGFSGVKSHSQGDVTPKKLAPLSYGAPKPVNRSNGSIAYSNASYGQISHNIPTKFSVQKV